MTLLDFIDNVRHGPWRTVHKLDGFWDNVRDQVYGTLWPLTIACIWVGLVTFLSDVAWWGVGLWVLMTTTVGVVAYVKAGIVAYDEYHSDMHVRVVMMAIRTGKTVVGNVGEDGELTIHTLEE